MAKYSLANYILSIDSNDETIKTYFGTISIGGEGSYLGTVRLSLANPMFNTTGFATGAWVHNKSLDRHGTANITLNQLSDSVAKFIKLAKLYYGEDYDGFTLSLSDIDGNKIATCVDCYISKIPDQEYTDQAGNQTWIFTCGQINFN